MQFRMIRRAAALVALCAVLCAGQVQNGQPENIRVLFIGNSYTYYNNLPRLLEAIAASQKDGPKIVTEGVLKGGETLQGHWDTGDALAAIRRGGWNFVVLQEQSALGAVPARGSTSVRINEPDMYFDYVRRFDAEIRRAGAQTVLYATWAREKHPEHQRKLDQAFVSLARELQATIVPVGLAWTIARIERPDWKLYMADGSHPTATGSYLAALVMYFTLTGKSNGSWVLDLPASVRGSVWPAREEVGLVTLNWSDKMMLSDIAWRASYEEPLKPRPAPANASQ